MSQRVECQANERNLTDRQQEAGGQQTSHTPPTSDPNSAHRFIIAIGLVFADSLDIPRGFTANVFLTDEANILNNPSVSDNFSRIDHLNSIKQQISKSLPQVSGEKLQILVSSNEKQMLESFFTSVQLLNPDFLIAFDCEKLAIGYIMRRSEFIFSPHLNDLLPSSKRNSKSVSIFLGRSPDPTSLVSSHLPSHAVQDPKNIDSPHDIDEEIDSVSDASHSSSSSAESSRVDLRHKVIRSIDAQQQFPGRIVLSVWRLISRDHKLRETSLSECLQLVLNKRVPHFDHSTLTSLVLGSGRRLKSKENLIFALSYLLKLCILNVEMISKMNSIPKISTFARIYGNQFQSYQRGSQVADSILSMAVKIVQDSAKYINSEFKQYSCEVVYGDTDSLFIQCRHKTLDEAFKIVGEMIKGINSLFPWPIKIKFEKIYMPSFLITKKRYAGLAFEKPPSSPESPGVFDAKGIETVRKNSCLLVANSVEKILMKIFDTKSRIFAEKCIRQEINRILSNNFQVEEMILHAELKPHTSVCTGAHSHRLPIHIIISKLRLQNAYLSPTFGQRLPYIIVNPSGNSETEPLYRLIHPLGAINDLHRIDITEINTVYYLTNLLLPALERILSLFHINVFAIYYDHVSDFSIESSKQASGHPIHSQRGLSIRVFEEDSRKFNEHSKLKSSNLQKNIEANAICCDCSGNDFIWRYCGSKSCQIWLKRYTF
ncbi:MAG: DNA polymerase zeta catalytic subunit [Marteilia pararefringens]